MDIRSIARQQRAHELPPGCGLVRTAVADVNSCPGCGGSLNPGTPIHANPPGWVSAGGRDAAGRSDRGGAERTDAAAAAGGPSHGQTWGKQDLSIQVIRDSGPPVDLGTALREVVAKLVILSALGSVPIVGSFAWLVWYLGPLWDVEPRTT